MGRYEVVTLLFYLGLKKYFLSIIILKVCVQSATFTSFYVTWLRR